MSKRDVHVLLAIHNFSELKSLLIMPKLDHREYLYLYVSFRKYCKRDKFTGITYYDALFWHLSLTYENRVFEQIQEMIFTMVKSSLFLSVIANKAKLKS